eukprot:1178343-Prorocentrum_minimum.AAC.1
MGVTPRVSLHGCSKRPSSKQPSLHGYSQVLSALLQDETVQRARVLPPIAGGAGPEARASGAGFTVTQVNPPSTHAFPPSMHVNPFSKH